MMANDILVLGAGRSSTSLIQFLLDRAPANNWLVRVGDQSLALAESKVNNHKHGRTLKIDASDKNALSLFVDQADIVISLLPPAMHDIVAHICLDRNKHLLTASYLSQEMKALHNEAHQKGLLFMGELGLDPGIDHMSAMQLLDQIREMGGKINAFRSYTGGLIAPESDNNPWHYKITWNPYNVVTAGFGGAIFKADHQIKQLPYHRLFRSYNLFDIKPWGTFEGYANRDSITYEKIYGLENTRELIRGTLRFRGFCDAWDLLVQLGLTDTNTFQYNVPKTYLELTSRYFPAPIKGGNWEEMIKPLLAPEVDVSRVFHSLDWLGLFSDGPIPENCNTPAAALQNLLVGKMSILPDDKDLVVMRHEIEYSLGSKNQLLTSTMSQKGINAAHTAMNKLVGLPLGIMTELLSRGEVDLKGVHIPILPEIYEPILAKLRQHHVVFEESIREIT